MKWPGKLGRKRPRLKVKHVGKENVRREPWEFGTRLHVNTIPVTEERTGQLLEETLEAFSKVKLPAAEVAAAVGFAHRHQRELPAVLLLAVLKHTCPAFQEDSRGRPRDTTALAIRCYQVLDLMDRGGAKSVYHAALLMRDEGQAGDPQQTEWAVDNFKRTDDFKNLERLRNRLDWSHDDMLAWLEEGGLNVPGAIPG